LITLYLGDTVRGLLKGEVWYTGIIAQRRIVSRGERRKDEGKSQKAKGKS
jgi:hypothetical protein